MRRTKIWEVTTEGRDKGKKFLLTEMDSDRGEDWALRALLALTNSGADLPDGILGAGWAGIAVIGLNALGRIPYPLAKPLFDEMWTCIQIVMPAVTRPIHEGSDGDIEEVSTRFQLRREVLTLHVDFLESAIQSISELMRASGQTNDSSSTSTSPDLSVPSSPPV